MHIAHISIEIPATKPDKGYQEEGPPVYYPHNVFPSSVTGIPGHPIENVTIENIELVYAGGGDKSVAFVSLDSLSKVPEQISEYPEFSMFGELPAWAFYVRHVEGLTMKNISVKAENTDYRPAYIFDDVAGLDLGKIKIEENDSNPQIVLKGVAEKSIDVDKSMIKSVQ